MRSLTEFNETPGIEELSALEQLRFFCSIAMSNQDWLDVEPFFTEIEAVIEAELAKPVPVAWMYGHNGDHWFQMYTPIDDVENYIPLYTHPLAQQKPLSDDEIQKHYFQACTGSNCVNTFARLIEQAHGIK